MYVCMSACVYVSIYVSVYVCMCVCMYVCMDVCIYIHIYYTYIIYVHSMVAMGGGGRRVTEDIGDIDYIYWAPCTLRTLCISPDLC